MKPHRKTDQVWRVWEDFLVFRDHRLDYAQIAEILCAHYEIAITPSQLRKVSSSLRRRIKAGLEPPRISDPPVKPTRGDDKPTRSDPFEQVRLRERAARADDQKVDEVFKTRKVSDLIRKDDIHGKNGG